VTSWSERFIQENKHYPDRQAARRWLTASDTWHWHPADFGGIFGGMWHFQKNEMPPLYVAF